MSESAKKRDELYLQLLRCRDMLVACLQEEMDGVKYDSIVDQMEELNKKSHLIYKFFPSHLVGQL